MNTLFVVENLSRGGAQRVIATLFPNIDESLSPALLLLKNEVSYTLDESAEKRVINIDAKRILTSIPKLAWQLMARRPTLIVSTVFFTDIVVFFLAKLCAPRSKLVFRSCNYFSKAFPEGRGVKAKLLLLAYRHANAVICTTHAMRDDFVRFAPQLQGSIVVIPNPVDQLTLKQNASAPIAHDWLDNPDLFVFIAVAKLKPQKNLALLVSAFAELDLPQSRLLILGKGPQLSELSALAAQLGVSERVDFAGFLDNPYPYMAAADCFVLSSDYEGFPNALVEAMCLQTPVISTDCPSGPSEILEHDNTGLLVPVGDCEALTNAMRSIAVDPVLRGRLAENGAASVQKFSAPSVSEEFSRFLASVR